MVSILSTYWYGSEALTTFAGRLVLASTGRSGLAAGVSVI
jgi:hypothetical protein